MVHESRKGIPPLLAGSAIKSQRPGTSSPCGGVKGYDLGKSRAQQGRRRPLGQRGTLLARIASPYRARYRRYPHWQLARSALNDACGQHTALRRSRAGSCHGHRQVPSSAQDGDQCGRICSTGFSAINLAGRPDPDRELPALAVWAASRGNGPNGRWLARGFSARSETVGTRRWAGGPRRGHGP